MAFMLVFAVAVVAGGVWMDSSLHRIPALATYAERPAAGVTIEEMRPGVGGKRRSTRRKPSTRMTSTRFFGTVTIPITVSIPIC